MRVIGIAWAKSSHRLNDIVSEMGGSAILISWMGGIKILAPIRYALLAIKTIFLLIKSKPDIIIAQNPPIFCPLSVYIYALVFKKKLVIDHHSLSIVRKGILWKILAAIEFWCMKRALTNTVIHDGYRILCKKMGVSSFTILDMIPEIPYNNQKFSKFTIISPLGGHPDEDLETLKRLVITLKNKNIRIITTGKLKKDLTTTIGYIGFLPRHKYLKVLSMAHLGLCLIKDNDWTLPYVIFEFIGSQMPFLVSKTFTTRIFGDFFLIDSKEPLTKLLSLMDQNVYNKSFELLTNLKKMLKNKRKSQIKNFKSFIYQKL